ncbi:MAG: hypothetical protein HOP95_04740 [Sphingomonas sp.]|nr:hypothetical protein [Sphingomonas sp.]
MRLLVAAALIGSALCSAAATKPAAAPVTSVMIVGGYHMSNPGHDLHDVHADDVLAPRRQKEIVAITNALARFHPTKVAVEWDAPVVAERYPKYLAGTLPPSRNEVVQLGFRLANTAHAQGVWGIDADGDFPYDRLLAYAKAHGQEGLMQQLDADIVRSVSETDQILAHGTVADALRYLNQPSTILASQQFYRRILEVGSGADQPGAELDAAWYKRNFLICAHLIQLARPGDRIVVFYGSGHAYLLRQCVTETPGFRLVEANDYLPR